MPKQRTHLKGWDGPSRRRRSSQDQFWYLRPLLLHIVMGPGAYREADSLRPKGSLLEENHSTRQMWQTKPGKGAWKNRGHGCRGDRRMNPGNSKAYVGPAVFFSSRAFSSALVSCLQIPKVCLRKTPVGLYWASQQAASSLPDHLYLHPTNL